MMIGRPRNDVNSRLAERLEETMLDRHMTAAELSTTLGFSPSTLSRALGSRSFSKRLKRALEAWLDTSQTGDEDAEVTLVDALQLLREMDRKLPAILKVLSSAVDGQAGSTVSSRST